MVTILIDSLVARRTPLSKPHRDFWERDIRMRNLRQHTKTANAIPTTPPDQITSCGATECYSLGRKSKVSNQLNASPNRRFAITADAIPTTPPDQITSCGATECYSLGRKSKVSNRPKTRIAERRQVCSAFRIQNNANSANHFDVHHHCDPDHFRFHLRAALVGRYFAKSVSALFDILPSSWPHACRRSATLWTAAHV